MYRGIDHEVGRKSNRTTPFWRIEEKDMINNDTELMKYILDDVQKYEGLRRFVKASIAERLFIKKRLTKSLHPNPEDEFSMPKIGPNFGIINNYCTKLTSSALGVQIWEPLMVEKMFPDGYMLLNGHHRWAAALKMNVKTVPVNIVNLTHAEDHMKMMAKTNNVKRITFDLDEVLCATEAHPKTEVQPKLRFGKFEKIFKERLRWGVPVLISKLQRMGYDVWVYTRTYNSVEYIQGFFKAYNVSVDGIINGAGRKKDKKAELAYKEMVAKKYTVVYHVDNESIVRIHPSDKSYEMIDLVASDEDWARKVMEVLNKDQEKS